MKAPLDWPLLRQLGNGDRLGRGVAVKSRGSERLRPRTADAGRVVNSV
jgi:formate dehydrogenase major subunit